MGSAEKPQSGVDAVVGEARRVVGMFEKAKVDAWLIGGVAVYLECPSARMAPLARYIEDVDFVGRSGQQAEIARLLGEAGYVEDRECNLLQGDRRLVFFQEDTGLKLDVFVGQFAMCHEITVTAGRGGVADLTSLLLTKLQVVRLNQKDIRDLLALLKDHRFGQHQDDLQLARIVEVTSQDWGLFTTVTDNLPALHEAASSTPGFSEVRGRLNELGQAVTGSKKSRTWKLRSRIGRRKRWYEMPEELE